MEILIFYPQTIDTDFIPDAASDLLGWPPTAAARILDWTGPDITDVLPAGGSEF